jgi:hypothetical protein
MKKTYTISLEDYQRTSSYTSLSSNPNIQFTQTTTNDKLENDGN